MHSYLLNLFFQAFYLIFIISVTGKKIIIDNRRPLKEELIRRVDCSLWFEEKCPQDGCWSGWGQWGPCKGECGQVGLRERKRLCDNPIPANGGLPCAGQHHQEIECRMPGCSETDYENIVQGDDFRMRELRILKKAHEVYPSLIDRCLESECHLSIVQSILQGNALRYWNALHCVKHNSGCPVLGGWSNWGKWSECSAKCGKGTQISCRSCDNPLPSYSKLSCKGENCTSRPCQGAFCGLGHMEGTWTSWTKWSPCSASCGSGLSQRTRGCSQNSISASDLENNLSTELGIGSSSVISHYFETSPILKTELSTESYNEMPFVLDSGSSSHSYIKFYSQNNNETFEIGRREFSTVSYNPFLSELNTFVQLGPGPTSVPQTDIRNFTYIYGNVPTKSCSTSSNKSNAGATRLPNQHSTKLHRKFLFWQFPYRLRSLHKERLIRNAEDIFCKGPHIELKSCFIKHCHIDGEWSEWEPWSQCSLACGMGVQSRSRACSAPPPNYGGSYCKGPVTHFKHCFLEPCPVNSHEVASFTGDGALKYLDMGKNIRLLHIMIRFRPIGPDGNLILRIPTEDPTNYVILSLIGGYIVFSASVDNCKVYLINYPAIELGKWIKVLIMVTPHIASMRIDDNPEHIKSAFSCRPKLPNFRSKMVVGQNFTGQIERLYINYLKRHLILATNQVLNPTNLFPYSNENVEYEQTEIDETFRSLDELILIPCNNTHNFSLIITVKGTSQDGMLMFMKDKKKDRSLILSIEPRRVQLHYVFIGGFIECYEVIEPHVGHWIHIKIDYGIDNTWGLTIDGGKRSFIRKYELDNSIDCSDFVLIGDVAGTVEVNLDKNIKKMFNNESLDGLLGYVEINGNILDISALEGKVEKGEETFSSEAISSSMVYNEFKLEPGEQVELSCVYKKSKGNGRFDEKSKPEWIKFDLRLRENNFGSSEMNYTTIDDSAASTVQIFNYSSKEVIEGFYSCWKPNIVSNSGNILITYGVTEFDPSFEYSNSFRSLLCFLHISFLVLLASTIGWVLIEVGVGPKYDWGFLSSKSLKKRVKKAELAYLSQNHEKRRSSYARKY